MGKISIPESAYFHGDEINQFIHIQVPMDLVVADCFKTLSGDSKILYGLLLNRTGLSIRKGWEDDKGRTYINYTVEDVIQGLSPEEQEQFYNLPDEEQADLLNSL